MLKISVLASLFLLVSFTGTSLGEGVHWKVTFISAIPTRQNVPPTFCQHFSPDTYDASIRVLQREGAKTQNGLLIKYRNVEIQQDNDLFFTKIEAVTSRQLNAERAWYGRVFMHLQQLTPTSIADGVWSSRDCKGRLIAEPQLR